jgi:hypothetical protein
MLSAIGRMAGPEEAFGTRTGHDKGSTSCSASWTPSNPRRSTRVAKAGALKPSSLRTRVVAPVVPGDDMRDRAVDFDGISHLDTLVWPE